MRERPRESMRCSCHGDLVEVGVGRAEDATGRAERTPPRGSGRVDHEVVEGDRPVEPSRSVQSGQGRAPLGECSSTPLRGRAPGISELGATRIDRVEFIVLVEPPVRDDPDDLVTVDRLEDGRLALQHGPHPTVGPLDHHVDTVGATPLDALSAEVVDAAEIHWCQVRIQRQEIARERIEWWERRRGVGVRPARDRGEVPARDRGEVGFDGAALDASSARSTSPSWSWVTSIEEASPPVRSGGVVDGGAHGATTASARTV